VKRRADRPGPFDWGSDGCTDAPDDPNDWNFRDACAGVEERRRCKAVAESYYATVRRTGGNSFYS
jgi:hypothetical protein